jgi:phage shock protein A
MADGPSAYRLAALIDQATQAQIAIQALADQCAAEITYLQSIADTAQTAETDSSSDRAAIHAVLDPMPAQLAALTDRVSALEAAQQPAPVTDPQPTG